MDRLKPTASILKAYLYQNLIGLELLCDWLEDPDRYEWVQFEADRDEAPLGLDDVAARRADGRIVLYQVKFTVGPNDPDKRLSWDWLLERKPKGRSLIQKWSTGLYELNDAELHQAALITNRLPDREFEACLDSLTNRVNWRLVQPNVQRQLVEHLASEDAAQRFFASFEFRHSHQGFQALERTLLGRFVPRHTNIHGWNALLVEATEWATRIAFPPPDGRIRISVLRGVISRRRPEPLSQSFRIPEGYQPPNQEFTNALLKALVTGSRAVRVIWGSPGQGKSTFLSHVCARLTRAGVPHVRHHYFLDLGDVSERLSYFDVANSLMAQMEAHHVEHVMGLEDRPEMLRNWIEVCAQGYAKDGKPFVVVIDGLDHVWRENDRNKEPLEALFRHLLPLPSNVSLVIGTQRVAPEQLPSTFATFIRSADWIELPRMSLAATKRWLSGQLAADRFELPDWGAESRSQQVTALAEKFRELSAGHPLHLTYAFEHVARERRVLTPELLDEVGSCPEGDIRAYYSALWQRLSYVAQDALHLVAAADFIWPRLGLESCLGVTSELRREIGHLFTASQAGDLPFHGSILAFVRDDPTHQERVDSLRPRVVSWLETSAPEFHRWGWLWLWKAKAGDKADLVSLPNRNWIIDSLAKGYPPSQIAAILSAAEDVAFASDDYPRAITLRWLKSRVQSGPEYQLTDFDRLRACAMALNDDDYLLSTVAADSASATMDDLYFVGSRLVALGRLAEATAYQERFRMLFNDHLAAGAFDHLSLQRASEQFLELAAATGKYVPSHLTRTLLGLGDLAPSLFRTLLRDVSKHQDLRRLIAFVPLSVPAELEEELAVALVRVAGFNAARLHDWPEFRRRWNHPLPACWALLYDRENYRPSTFVPDTKAVDVKEYLGASRDPAQRYLHALFFHCLASSFELSGADPQIASQPFASRTWLNAAVTHLTEIAIRVAGILSRGESPPYALPYRMLRNVSVPDAVDDIRDHAAFRRATLAITNDLFLLTSLRSTSTEVPAQEWEEAVKSPHFNFDEWLAEYLSAGRSLIESNAVESTLNHELASLTSNVTVFSERAEQYAKLCELALQSNLTTVAQEVLRRALSCVLGYGWRKDVTMTLVLDAVAALSKTRPAAAIRAVTSLCPAIARIDEITDGDGTRHTKFDMAELLLELLPNSYVAYHSHLLEKAEWFEAESVFGKLLLHQQQDAALAPCVGAAIWDSRAVTPLKKRAAEGDHAASAILAENAMRFGWSVENLGHERSYETPTRPEPHDINAADFAPEQIRDLLEALKEKKILSGGAALVREWFDHWRARGRGSDLLVALDPFLEDSNTPSEIAKLLDDVFALSRDLEGLNKAYKWLIAAHIQQHGWDVYYSDGSAKQRFDIVASLYRPRWKQFVRDTSKSPYKWASETLVIPSHRLVPYLLTVGETDVATEVLEAMVSVVVEEMSDQPLTIPTWFSGT